MNFIKPIIDKNYTITSEGKNTPEVISRSSKDHILDITKGALASFIFQFFSSEDGRATLEALSPDSVKFFIDRSFSEAEDPDKVRVQLASFYEEVRQHLPSILIVDSACVPVNLGFNPIHNNHVVEGDLISEFNIARRISLVIAIAAGDETTCSKLLTLLQFLFQDFRHFLGGVSN